MCRRNLFNPCVWVSKIDGFSARPRPYYFSANPMTFPLICHQSSFFQSSAPQLKYNSTESNFLKFIATQELFLLPFGAP